MRDVTRVMAASVLALESVMLFLTTPVLIRVAGVGPVVALVVGIGLAVVAVVLAGLLRHRWAYHAGSALQATAIGLGFVVPTMFVLGGLFAVFWVAALVLGRRVEALRAQRAAAE